MDILMEAGAVHYVPLNTGSGRQRTNTIKEKLSLTMSRSILISLSKNSLTLLSKDSIQKKFNYNSKNTVISPL